FLAASCAGTAFLVWEVRLARPASAADLGGDAALADVVAERIAAVAAVGPELPREIALRDQFVEEGERMRAFVFVARSDPTPDGPAWSLDGEVVLGRGTASVYRATTGEIAPFFASISDASITTRDQSSLPAALSSRTNCRIAFSQAPLLIHSCRRRR